MIAARYGCCAIAALAFAVLAACTPQQVTTRSTDVAALEQRAVQEAAAGNLRAAADRYAELAAATTGTARSGYLLEAARLSLDLGDSATARRRIDEARSGANTAQQQTIVVLLARIELAEGRPGPAIDLLATLPSALPVPVQRDAAAVRGGALFALGRYAAAVRTLTEREVWLDDARDLRANQRLIWDGFAKYPPQPGAAAPTTGDAIVDGWLALAPFAAGDANALRAALPDWRERYPAHPATALLAEMLAAPLTGDFPTRVALLLPLSHPEPAVRAVALAIRDGFMYRSLGTARGATVVTYDTAARNAVEEYRRAQLEGASFIVGPLLRGEVEAVVAEAGFVPTLALNYAQNVTAPLDRFYQFALASEDEARAAARAAIADGAKTALALAPLTDRGTRALDAFNAEFAALGGQLLEVERYEPLLPDYSAEIERLLNIDSSRRRHTRLSANLGNAPIEFEERRRDDADAIFLAADARAGRLLMSQLRRFDLSGDIAAYAISDVFEPRGAERDNDLNGVSFPDAPVAIATDGAALALRRSIERYWPQRGPDIRYYGMGFDAYDLIGPIYRGQLGSQVLPGMTGLLRADATGRIRRDLPLARFESGRPVTAEPAGSSGLVGAR